MKFMKKQKISASAYLFRLTFTAAMVALSVILCRFVSIPPATVDTAYRVDLGFLPLALVAQYFGAFYSAIGYLVADVIGSFVSGYAPNVWIALCKLLLGATMGFFFYKKPARILRTVLCFSVIGTVIDILFMSPIFIFMYGWTPAVAFGSRAVNSLITVPFRIVVYYFAGRALENAVGSYIKKRDKRGAFKNYANSFQAVTVPGLTRIAACLKALGDPQDRLRCIHIAGTNGKGSVSANIASILEAAGYRVGKYISPNLIRVNERISVNGNMISDDELAAFLTRIEPIAAQVEKDTGIAPTQFEIWTAVAFLYFAETGCDYVVLEVGLGGEFDATNVIKKNAVAVITRLDLDHTQYLGNTIEEVAAAKCGIMKADSDTRTVVVAEQSPEAMAVIEAKAQALGLTIKVARPMLLSPDGMHECFSIDGIEDVRCGIPAYHQAENAAIAAVAAKTLGIDERSIKEGISAAKNPARFEILSEDPPVIYDGGHNENGIKALLFSLDRYFKDQKRTVVFACMADKEIEGSLRLFDNGNTHFIFTEVKDNPRALSAADLKEKAATFGIVGEAFAEIGDAYRAATKRGELAVICGSLYLYKDLMEYLHPELVKALTSAE